MRALKLLALVLALSLPAWGLTNNGVSAPITGVGVANTDCPAAIANSSGGLGGTNGKAVATQLPNWAGSADVDVSGTFVATWQVAGSIDNLTYRTVNGVYTTNYFTVSTSSIIGSMNIQTVSLRYVCVYLTAYTSGTVVATIEPRASSAGQYAMLTTGGSFGGTVAAAGSASNQATPSISNVGLMTVSVADKSVIHQPAAATAASASITAGGGAVRHIGTTCTVYISTVAAQPDIVVNLRDGATGAGTVLWTGRVSCAITSGDQCKVQSPPLNVIGTGNTAMTCETATAPAVGNFAVATLTYHDAG